LDGENDEAIERNMIQSVPFVSILMPIRNEVGYIKQSLGSVLQQDYPPERIEILVIDGMSTDDTRRIIEETIYEQQACSPPPYCHVTLLDNPECIVATALNIGIKRAKGEIIIRVDGHCEIAPDYVSRCVSHLLDGEVDCVGGPMDTEGESFVSGVIALAMRSTFGVGNSAFRTVKGKSMQVDSVPFPAYRRETIEKIGFFDEEIIRNQDDEYNYRLRKSGYKILLAKDVKSKYYSRSSFQSLWKQYFQYGFWKVRVLQKHPGQMSIRQFIPPVFVLSLLLSIILSITTAWGSILLSTIIGCYCIANILASFWTTRMCFGKIFILPFAFVILHLSYGLGFIWGLIKFSRRWRDKMGVIPAPTS
jgi:succinoglycan biosynthesis protein ExoA